jgi:two-component system, cell cycle sensor histidine kinase PleC
MPPKPSTGRRGSGAIIGIFALLSMLPVIALGVGLGNVISSGVQQQHLADADRNADILAQAGIQPLLVPADLSGGISSARVDELDNSLRGVAFGKVVARLKVWNRQNVVVYSDNHNLIGKAFPADDHLDKALAGQTASEISFATSPENRADTLSGKFLSVYVPIYFAVDPQHPAGAFELYMPWAPVAAQIDQESQHLYFLLAIGLILLYLSMLPVLLVADRWRRRLTASLDSVDEERLKGDETARVSELKSTFLASMSHEMRTPLNAVLGYTQLLRTPGFGPLTPRQDKYIQNIDRAGRHLLALTNDVLDLSKIEAGKMDLEIADLELAVVVREAEEILRPLSDAKSLKLTIEPFGQWVKADRLRLTQVLVNLLSNAIKFTPEDGSVRVSARRSGTSIELDVTDNGRGVLPEDRTAIFERYGQGAGSRGEGTGLGLPLSRRLVELMGGELTLNASTPGGSTFRVRIPAGIAHTTAKKNPSTPRRHLSVVS